VVPYRPTLATYGEDHWRLFADDPSFPLPYVVRRGKEFPTNNLTPYQQTMLANWQQDTYAEFVLKDADAALATMTEDPYVFAIPSGTGGSGRGGVLEFYANQFLPKIPPDFEPTSLSQTFSNDRIVEEFVIRFTHTLDMDWMLPGVSATGRKAEFAFVGIIEFQAGKVASERFYWDQATVLSQLGIPHHPVVAAGIGSAAHLLNLR
jgi:carboxymethylenebutenolidase